MKVTEISIRDAYFGPKRNLKEMLRRIASFCDSVGNSMHFRRRNVRIIKNGHKNSTDRDGYLKAARRIKSKVEEILEASAAGLDIQRLMSVPFWKSQNSLKTTVQGGQFLICCFGMFQELISIVQCSGAALQARNRRTSEILYLLEHEMVCGIFHGCLDGGNTFTLYRIVSNHVKTCCSYVFSMYVDLSFKTVLIHHQQLETLDQRNPSQPSPVLHTHHWYQKLYPI